LQGYYVLTPFARADGGTVLVNRGFVPTELKAEADRRDGLIEGPTTVTGILRASEVRTANGSTAMFPASRPPGAWPMSRLT
jgi:surfeit locus 1 family protein